MKDEKGLETEKNTESRGRLECFCMIQLSLKRLGESSLLVRPGYETGKKKLQKEVTKT